jgi:hypothetical protein
MAEPTILTPIELTGAELDAVSGGANFTVRQSNRQRISQRITETGGSVHIGGGAGATTFSGTLSFTETFTASESATNTASNTNTANNNILTG